MNMQKVIKTNKIYKTIKATRLSVKLCKLNKIYVTLKKVILKYAKIYVWNTTAPCKLHYKLALERY